MEVLYPRCAGFDVHKDSVVARIRCVSEPLHDEVNTFATTTSALLELNEFLSAHGVTHVAMDGKVAPLRQCFGFGPTSSSSRERNSLRTVELFALL
jgi:hypothetical protein